MFSPGKTLLLPGGASMRLWALGAVLCLMGCGGEERREQVSGATIQGKVVYHREVFFGPRPHRLVVGGWRDDNPCYVIVEGTEIWAWVWDHPSGNYGTYRLTRVPTGPRILSAVREGYAKQSIEVQLEPNQEYVFDFDLFPHVTVLITRVGAEPDVLSIPRGATVTWVNVDAENRPHRVWHDRQPFLFDSGDLPPHGTFSYTFTQTGSIQYFLSQVEDPTGEIEVF